MNILIVDDNPVNLKVLRATLEGEAHQVLSATDSFEALALLRQHPVDAVVSHLLMPRKDGFRLCNQIRSSDQFRSLPVIVYTNTHTSPADEKIARDLGASAFVKKPSSARVILQALGEVRGEPVPAPHPSIQPAELSLLKQYSEPLVAKLEQKNLELQNITEQLLAHEAQLNLQATALESAANAILIADAKGVIQWINPAFSKLTGYSVEEALGKTPRILKSGKHQPDFYKGLWQTILKGGTWRAEVTNRRKDGTLFYGEQTITPVRGADGAISHFVGIMNDITERKKLEEQFVQSQKMEVIGHLAGGVAHDFNNILAVIIGYSDLMNLALADHPLQKHLHEIRSAAERASSLTQQLLIFTRKQKIQPTVLDLNQIVSDMEKMLRRLIDENIQLTILPGKEIGRLQADANYVGQVLMNLVVNARDAMPYGGKLKVETQKVSLDSARLREHPQTKPGEYVLLSVSDTGIGMSEEVKKRIFEPFFTTKPKGKGTGLGLATCQAIARQFNGIIEVESQPGRGTIFRVYFPSVNQPVAAAVPIAQYGALPRGSETLLLVEDERSVRRLAYDVLQSHGYSVLRASNGRDALNLVRNHKGSPVRLVVTDVIMPQMDGKVMAEWLKATYPHIKILFTSGYTDEAIAHHGVLEPGVAFLPKPYTPATLVRRVREILDNQKGG